MAGLGRHEPAEAPQCRGFEALGGVLLQVNSVGTLRAAPLATHATHSYASAKMLSPAMSHWSPDAGLDGLSGLLASAPKEDAAKPRIVVAYGLGYSRSRDEHLCTLRSRCLVSNTSIFVCAERQMKLCRRESLPISLAAEKQRLGWCLIRRTEQRQRRRWWLHGEHANIRRLQ